MKRFIIALLAVSAFLMVRTEETSAGVDVAPPNGGNEPHAAVVNPTNPHNVAMAQCTLQVSTDFGQTWSAGTNPGVPPGYPSTGLGCDDVLAFDSQGRLWWTYLLRGDLDNDGTNDDLTVAVTQVNPATGALVGNAIDVAPGAHSDDKQWMAADGNPASPFANNVYVTWTRFDNNPTEQMFSRCVNCGTTNTFSAPATIATGGGEGFRHQSHVTTAPNGDVYASYHINTCGAQTDGDIVLMRDSNGGGDLAVSGNPPAGVFKTTVFGAGGAEVTCNRQPSPPTVPNAHFLMQGAAAPFVVADPVRPGNIYVIVNDDPNNLAGSGDDGNVLLARSTNNGASFTVSRIDHAPTDEPASLQVFPQGTSDQDGHLAVFWYDTRRQINNNNGTPADTSDDYWNLDVYVTVSRDGAQTFSNDFRINDAPFDPQLGAPNFGTPPDNPPTFRIGEYNGLAATDGVGYATWTGNTGTGQQILFDLFSIPGAFPDEFEPNDAQSVATILGSIPQVTVQDATLHRVDDTDFYKYTAPESGKLIANLFFNSGVRDLELLVHDVDGTVIATATESQITPGLDVEGLVIPVVSQQEYWLQVVVASTAAGDQIGNPITYDLEIEASPAPVPFELDLVAGSDSGDNDDNLTNDSTPTIRMRVNTVDAASMGIDMLTPAEVTAGEPGYAVAVFVDGNFAGYASPVGGTNETMWEFTFGAPLADGAHSITAKVQVFDPATPQANGFGGESDSLLVTIDTSGPGGTGGPGVCATPDLLSTSDDSGINDDDVTRIQAPAFSGDGDAGAIVHVFSGAVRVGLGVVGSDGTLAPANDGIGAWEVTVEPLADGVHAITCLLEDAAGNFSTAGPALNVTIANQRLNLAATTAATIDLADAAVGANPPTVNGVPSPSATGKIGILGIPVVNLDVNGNALTILGTPSDDSLRYRPTGADRGTVTWIESGQVLNFTEVAGTFTVDPSDGADSLLVLGTVGADTIVSNVNTTTTVQVNSLKMVSIPIANLESLVAYADAGADSITINVFDTVNASVSAIGESPTTTPNRGDKLLVNGASPQAHMQKQPGGGRNAGSIFVTYPKTTHNQSRVDYMGLEKITLTK